MCVFTTSPKRPSFSLKRLAVCHQLVKHGQAHLTCFYWNLTPAAGTMSGSNRGEFSSLLQRKKQLPVKIINAEHQTLISLSVNLSVAVMKLKKNLSNLNIRNFPVFKYLYHIWPRTLLHLTCLMWTTIKGMKAFTHAGLDWKHFFKLPTNHKKLKEATSITGEKKYSSVSRGS